jgi:hypothetical protein
VYPIAISITYEPPPSKYARALHKVTKEVQREAAQHWHDRILPEHFKPGAAERYGYARRVKRRKLLRRKRRTKPHPLEHLPLIHTGAAMEDILSPPYIQSFPTRVNINLAAPSYFGLNLEPDMVEEVGTMTFQEQQAIMIRMGKNASRMLREMGGKETVVLTGG